MDINSSSDTQSNKLSEVFAYYQDQLRELWLSGNRNWNFYSKEKFSSFWSIRTKGGYS